VTVDIGFIGAGGRAGTHLDNLETIDDADVVAVCDIDEDAAREGAAAHDAAVYTDHGSMYAEEALDAVFVNLPPFAHTDQETMAAAQGIDLFVEKPIALSNEKAAEILSAIRDHGVIAMVGYQRRYADATHEAVELLEDRPIGLVESWFKWSSYRSDWWAELERSGGQVVEQATHNYDLVRLLAGDVEEVSADGSHRIVDAIDFEDCVTANLRHDSGAVSNLVNTTAASDGGTGTEVIAEDAHLHLGSNSFEGTVDGEEVAYEGENDPSRTMVEQFVAAVQSRDGSLVNSSYADAVETLSATLAVNESLETGEPVVPEH
jgi:predicted dehydrogenase